MNEMLRTSWRGVVLVVATYFYFLIFAQFAFLELAGGTGEASPDLKGLMAAMGLGGVLGSVAVPLLIRRTSVASLLRTALVVCSALAWAAPLDGVSRAMPALALGIGFGVGLLTVSLVTGLRTWMGETHWGLKIGFATGAAYACCNVPAVFQAEPRVQAWLAAGMTLFGLGAVRNGGAETSGWTSETSDSRGGFLHALAFFAVLIWFDSAAFYIIQHADALKGGTWGEAPLLWRNAVAHLLAAIAAGYWLGRARWKGILGVSFVVLAGAALSVGSASGRLLGGALYPVGVSLYSACLVAYPAYLLGTRRPAVIAWHAAVLYAVAGWMGSGLGIGMAENLHHVPVTFVLGAAAVLFLPMLRGLMQRRGRELAVCGLALAATWLASRGLADHARTDESLTRLEEGRRVYLSEGCIHCHSQYVRPGTRDVAMWGPVVSHETLMKQVPPLFGNRRQGPDLLNVGNRRSRAWLRQHFLRPSSVRPGSPMPSYAHLFRDERGEALLDYLQSLGRGTAGERHKVMNGWKPSTDVVLSPGETRQAFDAHCASCHDAALVGNPESWVRQAFRRPPTDFARGPMVYAPKGMPAEARQLRLAQIIKFGLPGTDMPGHEYLSDSEVVSLARFVAAWGSEPKP